MNATNKPEYGEFVCFECNYRGDGTMDLSWYRSHGVVRFVCPNCWGFTDYRA